MADTPRLYDTLGQVLSQHQNWGDLRHLKTLAWMMVGLSQSDTISLTAWTPSVHSRAVYAQRTVRRLARGLANERIAVHALYGPLLQHALAAWGDQMLSLALDTSMLWHTYGRVRTSLVSRGRAMPLVWNVREHSSSRVAYDGYSEGLAKVAEVLPVRCPVVFTAARGCADTHLMAHLARWGWHWRSRLTGSFWMYRHGKRRCQVNRIP